MPTPIPPPAVFPFEPDGGFPLVESWAYTTDILIGRTGLEKRVPLASVPRYKLRWTVTAIDPGESARFQALMWTETDNRWYIPRWSSARRISAVAAGVYTVDTVATSFVVGGLALVWHDSTLFDIMNVSAVGAGTVTLTGATTFAHTLGGTAVAPVLVGSIVVSKPVMRASGLVSRFEVEASIDVTSMPLPALGAPALSFRGVEVMPNIGKVTDLDENWSIKTDISGGEASSPFIIRPLETKNTVLIPTQWLATTRAEMATLFAFLARRQGQLNPVWMYGVPEFVTSADALSGAASIFVTEFDFSHYYAGDVARRNILINGVAYGIVIANPTGELTLDIPLASATQKGTPVLLLHFCRMAEDNVDIEIMSGVSLAQATLSFKEIPLEAP